MKIRRSILLFAAGVAILIGLILLWHRKEVVTAVPPTATQDTNSSQIAIGKAQPPNTGQTNKPIVDATNPNPVPTGSAPSNKAEQTKEILSGLNDVPITFYGKVEDQFGKAVTGAVINFGVRIYNGFESTVKPGEVTSDENGLFTISGYKGERLGIGVKKSGYAFVSVNGSTIYSRLYPEDQRAHPDEKNPVIIKMWKLQGAEPLISIDQHFRIPFANAPIYFDLVSGKIVETGGDLKITINRPSGLISERNPQDWGFNIEAINGGIMEASGESSVTFQAPDTGYEQNVALTAYKNRHGIGMIQQGFFLKSRSDQIYAKFSITMGINSSPDGLVSITFNGIANTNGSRNWEGTLGTANSGNYQ